MPLPHSPFVDSLLDLLLPLGGVSAKRMFGGYGIYKDGLMFGLVHGEHFYLKVDDENRPTFEAAGLEPFRFTDRHGETSVMSYYLAPEGAFANEIRMKPWASLGWQAAQRKASKTRTPGRKVAKKKQ